MPGLSAVYVADLSAVTVASAPPHPLASLPPCLRAFPLPSLIAPNLPITCHRIPRIRFYAGRARTLFFPYFPLDCVKNEDPAVLCDTDSEFSPSGFEPNYIKTQLTKWYQSNTINNAQKNKTTNQRA